MVTLNALFPIFALLCLGKLLWSFSITSKSYLETSDKLIYYIFFPVMLFWKIGGASQVNAFHVGFIATTILALATVALVSLLLINAGFVTAFQAGSFSQSCYRFNTYIGVAVILNSLGEAGIAYFGVMIAIAIPLINITAVMTLIWFSDRENQSGSRSRFIFKAIVSNPLIVGCILGLVYAETVGSFPTFIDNSFQMMSMVTLPLALLSIGATLSFKGVRKYLVPSLTAALLKLVLLPLVGYGLYKLFGVSGLPFQVGMIFFCIPTSTAIYVLSSQLKSDTELASSAIVMSTLLSFFSLTIALSFWVG